ncbi:MAG: hypothetical protein LC797_13140 [Chloroflexi bacterium]|nr:hypothetical protein [Chloroflexota bacterium]
MALVRWAKGIAGVVCVLLGLVWIGQGTNILPGSFMSGHIQYALLGLVVLIPGGWLVWSAVRARRPARATRT